MHIHIYIYVCVYIQGLGFGVWGLGFREYEEERVWKQSSSGAENPGSRSMIRSPGFSGTCTVSV